MNIKLLVIPIAICLSSMAALADASVITWQASQDLFTGTANDQSVVDTSFGNFVLGVNATDAATAAATASVTANGVVFTNIDAADIVNTGAGFTSNGVTLTSTAQRENQGAFQTGSVGAGPIGDLITGAHFDAATWTFAGLTPGDTYQFQIFTNDARGGTGQGGRDTNWNVGFSDGVAAFDPNAPVATSNLNNRDPVNLMGEQSGDFIIGEFIADATGTQSFQFQGTREGFPSTAGGQGQINALQLRVVEAVPEPSSLLVLSLGSLFLVKRRRS